MINIAKSYVDTLAQKGKVSYEVMQIAALTAKRVGKGMGNSIHYRFADDSELMVNSNGTCVAHAPGWGLLDVNEQTV